MSLYRIIIVYICLSHNCDPFLDVQPVSKEVETATEATISCIISGITQQLDSVVWRKDGTDVTTLPGSNYVLSPGTYDSNSQTTTLTVKAAANTADTIYSCGVTSNEFDVINQETPVSLEVFGKSWHYFLLATLCRPFIRLNRMRAKQLISFLLCTLTPC